MGSNPDGKFSQFVATGETKGSCDKRFWRGTLHYKVAGRSAGLSWVRHGGGPTLASRSQAPAWDRKVSKLRFLRRDQRAGWLAHRTCEGEAGASRENAFPSTSLGTRERGMRTKWQAASGCHFGFFWGAPQKSPPRNASGIWGAVSGVEDCDGRGCGTMPCASHIFRCTPRPPPTSDFFWPDPKKVPLF